MLRPATILAAVLLVLMRITPSMSQNSSEFSGFSGSSGSGGFICDDGSVIAYSFECDQFPDCPDGSDEEDCEHALCGPYDFRCPSGQCLTFWQVCNGQDDCGDNSDEDSIFCITDPDPPVCNDHEFMCDDQELCIPAAYRCDGDNDCYDASDENDCSTQRPSNGCDLDSHFACDSGDLCVPLLFVCDGEPDCFRDYTPPTGDHEVQMSSDEMDCEGVDFSCGEGFFNCSNSMCIRVGSVCDGTQDCSDGSDEEDCPGTICDYDKFSCPYFDDPIACVPRYWLCDGTVNCNDGSDERNCGEVCDPAIEFTCTTSGHCITLDQMCDGVPQCRDSSDEYVCPFMIAHATCLGNQFTCLDGQDCLELENVCDGVANCIDQSDEGALCNTTGTCAINNGGCEQRCTTFSGTRRFCSCNPGFELDHNDLSSCHDVNECEHPDTCSQLCNNTVGSYECSCVEGYTLTASGECRATGPDPYILYANRIDIRTVGLNGSARSLLIDSLHYAVAIDYHYELGYFYWTDFHDDDIKRANFDGSNITTIISTGLSAPDGLAVDWVNDKLYIADALNTRMEVSDLDGRKRKILFSTNLGKPRAVVVDPKNRYLFWTDWGDSPKIERCSMDGTGRTVLHRDHLNWPNALTIDYPTGTLYWADAKLHIIESSTIDGLERRPIVTEGVLHPFGLTVFEDRLYWSDWNMLSIVSVTKSVGRNRSLVEDRVTAQELQLTQNATDVVTDLFFPTDLHVVHPVLQPPMENPCEMGVANGGCEYLCLLSAEAEKGFTCACQTGIELAEDGKGCQSKKHNFVW